MLVKLIKAGNTTSAKLHNQPVEVYGVCQFGIGFHCAPIAAPEGAKGGAPAVAVVSLCIASALGCQVHNHPRSWLVASWGIIACMQHRGSPRVSEGPA